MKKENLKKFTTSSEKITDVSEEMQKIIDRQNALQGELNKASDKSVNEQKVLSEEAELVPLGTNVLVRPYSTNPYAQMQFDENGVIVSNDIPHKVKNEDSGELETAEEFIIVARVKEIGPDVKNIMVGDDIYYTKPSSTPIPFLKLGMYVVSEQRVLAIVNNNVKSRWKI